MKREIKFRYWDDGEMIQNVVAFPGNWDEFHMQFTGLYDTNKKEIYEGDIVKASIYSDEPDSILEVRYESGCFVIDYKDSESDLVPLGWFAGQVEIIGNIYETPELLQ